jgi:hypothetical protein
MPNTPDMKDETRIAAAITASAVGVMLESGPR